PARLAHGRGPRARRLAHHARGAGHQLRGAGAVPARRLQGRGHPPRVLPGHGRGRAGHAARGRRRLRLGPAPGRTRERGTMSWLKKKKTGITTQDKKEVPEGLFLKCDGCGEILYQPELEAGLWTCPKCGHHFRIASKDYVALLVDPGTFEE